jgi:hypothetical protein
VLAAVNLPGASRAPLTRAPGFSPAAATSAAAGKPPYPSSNAPLDVTAESPDSAALSEASMRRVLMLAAKQNEVDQETQVRLDRMRAEFDDSQAERAELMREANVLRDMAMEQQKRDDEILKKWIALI